MHFQPRTNTRRRALDAGYGAMSRPARATTVHSVSWRRSAAFGLGLAVTAGLLLLWASSSRGEVLIVLADGTKVRADTLYVDEVAGALTVRSERNGVRMERRVDPRKVAVVMNGARVVYSAARSPNPLLGRTTRTASAPSTSPAAVELPESRTPPRRSAASGGTVRRGVRPAAASRPGEHRESAVGLQPVGWRGRQRFVVPGLPSRSIVVGTRGDPLNAYDDLLRTYYPSGIPPRERGIVLQSLRNVRLNQMLADSLSSAGFDLPLLPTPGAFLQTARPTASGDSGARPAGTRALHERTPPILILYQRNKRSAGASGIR